MPAMYDTPAAFGQLTKPGDVVVVNLNRPEAEALVSVWGGYTPAGAAILIEVGRNSGASATVTAAYGQQFWSQAAALRLYDRSLENFVAGVGFTLPDNSGTPSAALAWSVQTAHHDSLRVRLVSTPGGSPLATPINVDVRPATFFSVPPLGSGGTGAAAVGGAGSSLPTNRHLRTIIRLLSYQTGLAVAGEQVDSDVDGSTSTILP